MLVNELIAECRRSWCEISGSIVTIEGHLRVAEEFAWIGATKDASEAVLIRGGLLYHALRHKAGEHILGGSWFCFEGRVTVSGTVSSSAGIALFPAVLYDLSEMIFEPQYGGPIRIDLKRPMGQAMEVGLFEETPNQTLSVIRLPDQMWPSLVLDCRLLDSVVYLAERVRGSQDEENREFSRDAQMLAGYILKFRDYLEEVAAKHELPLPRTREQ